MARQEAYTFRDAVLADAPAVAAFVNAVYHGPEAELGWTPETHLHRGPRTSVAEVAGFIGDGAHCHVLCEERGQLAGCALIQRFGDGEAHFGMFAVATRLQGAGVGKLVMAQAERRAVELWGVRVMRLTVMSPQDKLIAFYERRGYRLTGEREPFPFDAEPNWVRNDFDVLVMRKTL